jgi:hypothetical protein
MSALSPFSPQEQTFAGLTGTRFGGRSRLNHQTIGAELPGEVTAEWSESVAPAADANHRIVSYS